MITISIDKNNRYKFVFTTVEQCLMVCDRLNRRYRIRDEEGVMKFPFWSIADERKFAIGIIGINIKEYIEIIQSEFPEIEITNSTLLPEKFIYKLVNKLSLIY